MKDYDLQAAPCAGAFRIYAKASVLLCSAMLVAACSGKKPDDQGQANRAVTTPVAPPDTETIQAEPLRACTEVRLPPWPQTEKPTEACGKETCSDGVELSLEWAALQSGTYRFVLVGDRAKATCEARLPLPPCGTEAATCDAPWAHVTAQGCGQVLAKQGFSSISLQGCPLQIGVTVERDGQPLATLREKVDYGRTLPNGEGCSPQCVVARDKALWVSAEAQACKTDDECLLKCECGDVYGELSGQCVDSMCSFHSSCQGPGGCDSFDL